MLGTRENRLSVESPTKTVTSNHLTVPQISNQPRLSTISVSAYSLNNMAAGLDENERRLPTYTRVIYCGSIVLCVAGMSITVAGSLCVFIFLGSRAGGQGNGGYWIHLYVGVALLTLGLLLLVSGTVLCCCVSPTFGSASMLGRLSAAAATSGASRGGALRGDESCTRMMSRAGE